MKYRISTLIGIVLFIIGSQVAIAAKPGTGGPTEIRDIDNPAHQPIQYYNTYTIPAGVTVYRQPIMQIPAGKRFVLEFMSVNYVSDTTGIGTRGIVEVSDTLGVCPQDPAMRHVLQKPEEVHVASTVYNYVVSQSLKLYADPYTQLCLHFNRAGDVQSRDIGVHVTGYYVDVVSP